MSAMAVSVFPLRTQTPQITWVRSYLLLVFCRILVSSSRKPASYINLAKRFLSEHGEVQLGALGVAISHAVALAETLKAQGFAVDKSIQTSLEAIVDGNRCTISLVPSFSPSAVSNASS